MTAREKISEYQQRRERILRKWNDGEVEKETAQVCIGELNRWIEGLAERLEAAK